VFIKKPSDIKPSEITSETNYLNRRNFIKASSIAGSSIIAKSTFGAVIPEFQTTSLTGINESQFSTSENPNTFEDISTYNNFYEFGTQKSDPSMKAKDFKPRPWKIKVSGHAEKIGVIDFDEFMKPFDLEERIYRMRCVEAWSMVIPWVGISLAKVINHFQPTSKAKYIAFETLKDSKQMPGQKSWVLDWPYREGLTIEEATNPLTILAIGIYGKIIPNQNGAPIRLVVPWKYGFKSIKSIVSIKFMSSKPKTSWNVANPKEYGFFANVNPNVDHPRWSQSLERRIGSGIFAKKQKTKMFNGYGEHVAHLYKDLDLYRNF
tara:strand:- start:2358 stop:3317 length:960 start_codon:yes stop_codon:yes gene_type:complete